MWISLGLVLPILAGGAYFLVRSIMQRAEPPRPPEQVIALNSSAQIRVLRIPFSEVSMPGLSPDGSWISFPAADTGNRWDIYAMQLSGKESRRITFDSSGEISETDISPDGRMIVYDRWNPGAREFEVRVVPALGGASKRIAEPGMVPRWRPDGRRIGYMVKTKPFGEAAGSLEFRSVRPDGSDPRVDLEEPDDGQASASSFAWSPDGKSIALVRTFREGYQEVFINGFESGKKANSRLTSSISGASAGPATTILSFPRAKAVTQISGSCRPAAG